MKPLLAFALASMMATGVSQHLPAQHAFGSALTHIASAGRERPSPIPLDETGAAVQKQYSGGGLSVCAMPQPRGGARLRCRFQKLEGEATRGGLWLTSTAEPSQGERFRVVAASLGRVENVARAEDARTTCPLPLTGTVAVTGKVAGFIRPGLTEEYSVRTDGVRQDFIIERRPEGEGELRLELAVSGAKAEPLVPGARLVLDGSGRKIAYCKLRVTDATGRGLPARMKVVASSELAVAVNDTGAVYPVRIDPTFSDANWISTGGFAGVNGPVLATAVRGSGSLYIGGSFTIAGEVFATNIAKWNGTSWSALGSGIDGQVSALAVSGGDLYAGGSFTNAGGVGASNIAKWNGTSWSALGSGIGGAPPGDVPAVYALAVSGTNLYAGGWFTTAGGAEADSIAKWDGSNWSALGSGMGEGPFGSYVYALAVSGTDLYAGGLFTSAGGVDANSIAKWDWSNWSALGSGMGEGPFGSYVYALAVSGTDLYAGGLFTSAGGVDANSIAKWDGSNWSALGWGIGGPTDPPWYGTVFALAVSGGNLYAAGSFPTAGFALASNIAKWDGSTWSALGLGIGGMTEGATPQVYALAVSGPDLYAGGIFATAGGVAATNIAKWNGSTWSVLGPGIGGGGFPRVSALAVSGPDLYAGGIFTTSRGVGASFIARWNGKNWSPPGSGMNSAVYALAKSGSDLYAGGSFTSAGSAAANNIARWNGSSWAPLGSGMGGGPWGPFVSGLAVSGPDLYAGGNFTTAGGTAATNIAEWNGSSWAPLGSGIGAGTFPSYVNALAVSGGDLYAGGYFTNAGGASANCIAKWNGSSWSSLGSGMRSASPADLPVVFALAVSGTDLYAGGYFASAGGISANSIAKWNGSSWSPLGSGMGGGPFGSYVYALAVSGTNLYAGGLFTNAGGISANYIAKWNGRSWSALGSGIDGRVSTLAVSGSDLYAGGSFTNAGGFSANCIAKWTGGGWLALGSGMGGAAPGYLGSHVSALAVSSGALYVGGWFMTAGGKLSPCLARVRVGSIATSLVTANSTASIQFSGVTGYQYDVQRATNLNPPMTWTTVTTNLLSPADDGSFTFTDTDAPPGTAYYRALER